jgi:murein DD-endopeptidase MepM/ murein hydrolase activator NlpD
MRSRPTLLLTAAALLVCGALVLAFSILQPRLADTVEQVTRLRSWFANPADHADWLVLPTQRCSPDAPMVLPTAGYIGFGWDDSFRPGHRHSGYDIFSPDGAVNVTPVVAAYDGYLTREPGWRSAVIIRHPDFPAIVPGEQIWTFYTHMASADGAESFIAPQFPAGAREVFVPAGTLLGYQGNWSGSAGNPTGIHLHFSIVQSTPSGGYADETDIDNTYDPAPFLGVARTSAGVLACGSLTD